MMSVRNLISICVSGTIKFICAIKTKLTLVRAPERGSMHRDVVATN